MKIELVDYTKDGIQKIARLSMSTRRRDLIRDDIHNPGKFVKMLINIGHHGVLEHVYFTFFISGISRITSHQLIRHRIASYLQMTNRHVGPDKYKFIIPKSIRKNIEALDVYKDLIYKSYDSYQKLIELGIPKEDARYLLPPSFETHISLTMNVRELRHFFELRCEDDAQWEIRELAKKMLKICYDVYPILFEDLYGKYK